MWNTLKVKAFFSIKICSAVMWEFTVKLTDSKSRLFRWPITFSSNKLISILSKSELDSNTVTWAITNSFLVNSLLVLSSCVRFAYYLFSDFFDLLYFSYLAPSQHFPFPLLCVVPVLLSYFLCRIPEDTLPSKVTSVQKQFLNVYNYTEGLPSKIELRTLWILES